MWFPVMTSDDKETLYSHRYDTEEYKLGNPFRSKGRPFSTPEQALENTIKFLYKEKRISNIELIHIIDKQIDTQIYNDDDIYIPYITNKYQLDHDEILCHSLIWNLHTFGTCKDSINKLIEYKSQHLVEQAALFGNIDLVRYAVHHGCEMNKETIANACLMGHVDILKWALKHNCPVEPFAMAMAAKEGHLECISILRKNNVEFIPFVASAAAEAGQLEILKYLHINKCPWDTWTTGLACKAGKIDCLNYAITNGCEYNLQRLHKYAKNKETLEWLDKLDSI